MTAWPAGDGVHEREVTPDSGLVEALALDDERAMLLEKDCPV